MGIVIGIASILVSGILCTTYISPEAEQPTCSVQGSKQAYNSFKMQLGSRTRVGGINGLNRGWWHGRLCSVDDDCKHLAQAIVYEARGESREGRLAVGTVVLNRVGSGIYPNTIGGVLSQPYQFSYKKDMHKQSTPTEKDWDKAYKDAYYLLNSSTPENLEGVMWYHAKHITPYWSSRLTQTTRIGGHYFYK